MSNLLVIMSGIPGSGKSTYVRENYPDAVVCSADDYFTDSQGHYFFQGNKLNKAHLECKMNFVTAIGQSKPLIVVDNTNLNWRETGDYVETGLEAGYNVLVVRLLVEPEVAASRNVHGVPAEAINRMSAKTLVFPVNVIKNPMFELVRVNKEETK